MGDGAGDGTQDTFACLATAHEDDDIIRVPNETVSASFEFSVKFVEDDVTEQRRDGRKRIEYAYEYEYEHRGSGLRGKPEQTVPRDSLSRPQEAFRSAFETLCHRDWQRTLGMVL